MLTKNQIIILGAVGFVVLFFILGLLGVIPIFKTTTPGSQTGTQAVITFWGIDNVNNFRTAFENYNQTHQNIRIDYQQIDEKNYENTLLNALATGKGPDIFMINRSWLLKHGDKMTPANDTQFSLYNLRQLFPDVIEKDFTMSQKVYALPLYLDSLALFYNKDIFNAKSIAVVPTTWDEVRNIIPTLTEFDFTRQIRKSAVAIGGSNKSIDKASNLLSLLMLQINPQFVNDKTAKESFDSKTLEAFNYYLQFADPSQSTYTWSDSFGNSIDAFASGDAAMIFNYAKKISDIKRKNPYLNFDIGLMPQFNTGSPINYADYWGLAVSKQSKSPQTSWGIILSLTTNPQINGAYLADSKLPPALRTSINSYLTDPNYGVFAKQALTTKPVYQYDYKLFSQSFSNMIESVLTGKLDSGRALQQAAGEINGQQ